METKILPSVCTMDCPDTCSLDVEVHDGRIAAIRGSRLNPTTAGFICSKISNFTQRVYSPLRLLYPMKRTGSKGAGKFERISWEEATKTICDKFHQIRTEFGGEAILPFSYGGSNGILGQETSDRAFFAKLGASQLERTVCAAPSSAAAAGMYGKMAGVAFEDYVNANLIVMWGANPKASNIHLVPFLKKAKAKGAKVVIVDPRLKFSDREIDLHLPVFPGADLPLALGMIRFWNKNGMLATEFLKQSAVKTEVLLEKAEPWTLDKAAAAARVKASDIETLARMYAETNPAVIRVGWGMERNVNGGQATAAVLAMPALLGKFGVRGGGYTLSNSAAARIVSNKLVDAQPWNTRSINMNLLGRVLLDEKNPPVKGLFVYNCNPAATMPNQNAVLQGLTREDLFTVVFEQIINDTAVYADILLPAVTFLEQQEIKKAYGSYAVQYTSPVIEPCGEARPNEEVFALLGRGMGWNDSAFQETTEDYLRRAASAFRGLSVDLDELKTKRMISYDFPGPYPVQFKTARPGTPDGKVNFAPDALGPDPYNFEEIPNRYPFALISPANNKMISSTMGEYNYPELFVTIHPEDAKSRGLNDGSKVRVFNELGEVHCRVKINDEVRPGVVAIPKGAWRKSSLNGQTATALAPDTLGTAGGACFNDARVDLAAL
ncbi:MAG: molybdopterin oxidoreductase [Acidobacteria bacterium]|nr:MAG: molybdopterin oxidoreductase [Acidobacteriota bacterium]